MITTVTHLPYTHPMQAVLASTDLRASRSSCPVGTPLVDSFCSTSLQHPSFLGTDTPVPATKGQRARKMQTLEFCTESGSSLPTNSLNSNELNF